MSQGMIIFIAIGVVLSYFLIGFVNSLDSTSSEAAAQEKKIASEDQVYHRKDTIGQTILVFENIPYERKLEAWRRSPLRGEFIGFFPNFAEMRLFANDRIIDQEFQEKMIQKIDETENAYFSGEITKEQARDRLDSF